MKLIGLIRLGRDVELRYSNNGTPVADLSGAWNYGQRGQDGKQPTMWASFSIWGERAEKLAPHLLRGKQLFVVAGDVHVQTYEGQNGPGHKLVGRIESVEFAGSREDGGQRGGDGHAPAPAHRAQAQQQGGYRSSGGRPAPGGAPAPRPAPAPAAPAPGGGGGASSGFDDMDDDIPFVSMHADHDPMLNGSKVRRVRAGR